MRYLVTGGAGFIGSNIVEKLVQRGERVRVLDNLSSGKLQNLEGVMSEIEFIEGDIRDFWTTLDAVDGCDFVLHQAALPSVPRSVKNPQTTNAVNIDGTLNVLEAARRTQVKKVVFASSSSVYGDSMELPKHEDMTPNPLSPYAVTKLTGEHYMKVYWELYRLPTVSLRYFNIFGPRQDPNSQYSAVVPSFITALANRRAPIIYGDGEQSRDFTFISCAVDANICAANTPEAAGTSINVACGAQYTLNALVTMIGQIMNVKIDATYEDAREGDIKHSFGSVAKADRLLKGCVRKNFAEGLRTTIDWFAAASKFDRTPVNGIRI